jgi:hypothetical protein
VAILERSIVVCGTTRNLIHVVVLLEVYTWVVGYQIVPLIDVEISDVLVDTIHSNGVDFGHRPNTKINLIWGAVEAVAIALATHTRTNLDGTGTIELSTCQVVEHE